MITNDTTLFGLICAVIFLLFQLEKSHSPWLKKLTNWVPPLVICYLLMGGLNSLGVINGNSSNLYKFSTRYLLPPAMIYMTMAVDMGALKRLGWPSLLIFVIGTLSIIIGGACAVILCAVLFPELMQLDGPKEIWRGFATVTGSWIGGSASQLAAKEVFQTDEELFSAFLVADTIVQNIWLALLLQASRYSSAIDRFLRADSSMIVDLEQKIRQHQEKHVRTTTLEDFAYLLFVGFGGMALAHAMGDGAVWLMTPMKDTLVELRLTALTTQFFWVIVISTLMGIGLSQTRFKHLEGVGATKLGILFIYIVICTIGMQIRLDAIGSYWVLLVPVALWILIHGVVMLTAAYFLRMPLFFVAVASQANIGGPASAGVVAAAFSPILTPVAVLLATLSNVIGAYGAILSGVLMEIVFHWFK